MIRNDGVVGSIPSCRTRGVNGPSFFFASAGRRQCRRRLEVRTGIASGTSLISSASGSTSESGAREWLPGLPSAVRSAFATIRVAVSRPARLLVLRAIARATRRQCRAIASPGPDCRPRTKDQFAVDVPRSDGVSLQRNAHHALGQFWVKLTAKNCPSARRSLYYPALATFC